MMQRRLFAVLDIDHPMVAWEVAIGRILASPLKDSNNKHYPTPSLWLYNNLYQTTQDGFITDLISEIQIEKVRADKFPEKPSRLVGAFFFESYYDAVNACKSWEWESKIDYISEIDFNSLSYLKLDSNWITNKIRCCEKEERIEFIEKYYRGETLSSRTQIYEIICTGFGDVLNMDLRRAAYKKVRQSKPDASFLLALAMSCYDQNKERYRELLRVTPYIMLNENDDIEGSFIIDMDLFNKDEEKIGKLAKRHIHNYGTSLSISQLNRPGKPLKIYRPINQKIFFSLNDLTHLFFTMSMSEWEKIIS